MSDSATTSPAVALLYGEESSSRVLRTALEDIGVRLVCDERIDQVELARLDASTPDIVLISLDAEVEERLDDIYDDLDEERYRILFDDPAITNALEGWEHARWQRHLAAKLYETSNVDPPRPEGALAVEVGLRVPDVETAVDEALALLVDDAPEDEPPAPGRELDLTLIEDLPPDEDEALTVEAAAADEPEVSTAGVFAADAPDSVDDELLAAAARLVAEAADLDDHPPGTPLVDLPSAEDFDLAFAGSLELDEVPEVILPDESVEPAAEPAEPEEMADSVALATEALAPAEDFSAFDDLDDARLQAELDALADADDPLAALSALAEAHDSALSQAMTGEDDVTAAAAEPFATDTLATSDELDADLAALEAELNAAFDEETLDAIGDLGDAEAAGALPERQPWEEAAASEQPVRPDADAGGAPDLSDPVAAEPEPVATASGAPAVGGDSSTWSLVDDDAGWGKPDAVPEPVPPDEEPVEAEAGAETGADAGDDEGFKLALLEPDDYLEPEVRRDVSTELFSMPGLIPMAEAVAPEVGDEGGARDRQAPPLAQIVVLAAALGGPDAVRQFLAGLPPRLPASLLVVQHLGSEFLDLLASQLSKSCALPVRIPGRGERVIAGEVLVIPNGTQVVLQRDGRLQLTAPETEGGTSLSINEALSSLAGTFGADVTAIIFSGMGQDAVEGARAVAAAGGRVWVQDPESCVVSTMVDAVLQAGLAEVVATPSGLAERLVAHFKEIYDAAGK